MCIIYNEKKNHTMKTQKLYIDYAPTRFFKKVASPSEVAAHADNFGRDTDLRHMSVIDPSKGDDIPLSQDEIDEMETHIKQCEKENSTNPLLDDDERLMKAIELNQQLCMILGGAVALIIYLVFIRK
jgi:hypothetical protein